MMRPVSTNVSPSTQSAPPARTPVATFDSTGTIRIGRDADNDIVLADFWVSRKHAEVRKVGNEYHIVDLASSNGLHHNGRRVPKGVLTAGDRFTIGRHEFLFDGMHLFQHDDQGPTSIIADDITVEVKKAVLLDDVSFALRHGTLLGIVGPSGCGKSTLLKAMTGIRPATRGRMLYDGKDLYENYSELRYRIGMVPQEDVLHRQLTVRRALRFAASLRFADDVPRKQRKERVGEVLDLLGLTSRAKQRIDTLSGGQLKRTSVALELLTEPSLLALDEPTSGLDPALDKEVMRELRLLADRGRTVVVVTHSVLHLELCDHVLVMCLGGRMGYFGPPDELLGFFQAEDYADVFDKVTNDPDRWAQLYRNSDIYRRYVGEVALELAAKSVRTVEPYAMPTPRAPEPEPEAPAEPSADGTAPEPVADPAAGNGAMPSGHAVFRDAKGDRPANAAGLQDPSMAHRALHPVAPVRQFVTLCLRMISVILADRGYATFLIGLPLALAVLSFTVPGSKGLGPDPAGLALEAQRLLVVFVIGAAFMGIAVAIREIVNEQSIYRRERAIGLSPTAYLASKVLVFILIDTIQVVLFVNLAMLARKRPPEALVFSKPLAEIVVAVTLVSIASTAIGLLASALVRTTEQTTPILVVSVMTQLVLSGGLFVIAGQKVLEIISWIDPSRWGFGAAAATTNLIGFPFPDPLWAHDAFNWWRAVIILIGQIALLFGVTRLALRRFEPGKG
jgi:ABC-type multidrug transport system ATPase subunit